MRITFEHISKTFSRTQVLHDICLEVAGGEILALLGENGAGKSTLMNILGGLIPPTEGRILIDGKPVPLHSPNDSISHGIAFIHQELSPVNDLNVYENIFLGRELRSRFGVLKRTAMCQKAQELLDTLGVDLSADCPMSRLDAAHKQIVEIARALQNDAQAIIMDEPTTSLAEHEIALLFAVVRALSAKGVAIIFISHKLNEVKELCSSFAVLRNGVLVVRGKMEDVSVSELSEHIVGRELSVHGRNTNYDISGDELFRVEDLTHEPDFRNIDFTLHRGEILGFTGLLGDGRTEIFRSIFGDTPDYSGKVFLKGRPYHAMRTSDAVAQGIAYVPSNRKENAIVPDLSILANGTLATLAEYKRGPFINESAQRSAFLDKAGEMRVKYTDANDMVTVLSGGNQQKVVLTRWLNAKPDILILDNPTQGVDIGAKQEIYEMIQEIAKNGVSIIVLSGEGAEIVRLCHRAIVLYHGKIAGELVAEEINEPAIMALATGAINR